MDREDSEESGAKSGGGDIMVKYEANGEDENGLRDAGMQ
jgi:hypothetical protein